MRRDDATERQVQAARPDGSTWLSANAGSGKTRVLTDRVARLLLSGVEPQHILCLTYTKAAASEMQNRLFKRLGGWAMRTDSSLRDALRELGIDGEIHGDALRQARTLFARAIETPGGLKIQTIHSFCASLLRRFPLEARVTPQFTEMDDHSARQLRAEILQSLAEGKTARLVEDMATIYSGSDFDDLTRVLTAQRDAFQGDVTRDTVLGWFGLAPGYDAKALRAAVFNGDEPEILRQLVPAMLAGGPNDCKQAARLALLTGQDLSELPELENIFLYGGSAKNPFGAKIEAFPSRDCRKTIPDILDALNDWMTRVEQARESRLALAAAEKTLVLHRFARAFLPAYERQKTLRGWLDFDDLIVKARDLLTDPAVAAWVLYRLDGGIDHILVDEAQDTSPVQWQVIERLAQEFTSGAGARADVPRTIFVVGDKKQSIYSFQGADPREFDRMQAEFAQRLVSTNRPLSAMELEYSFRSAEAVLRLVDQTFVDRDSAGFAGSLHRAFKADMPGRVDLWPAIEKPAAPEKLDWHDPVDRRGESDHMVLLADRIASEIRRMVDQRVLIPVEIENSGTYRMRPVREGDVLILVQRRSSLFREVIRACKDKGLEVAGADRLKVGAELAVRDLAALLSFLATPEDDLSLAVALKSPLFGWTEQQLFTLAQGRKGYLWEALRNQTETHPDTLSILNDLRDQTDFLRPYELIETILTRHDGRRRILGRLGQEAEDGIDAFLAQALAYERGNIPSLTGFLTWMETDELEIKRQMDAAGNRIRVMTVHGAKGLEAPIVILPDAGRRDNNIRDMMLVHEGKALWKTPGDDAPATVAAALQAQLEAQEAERDRLLYVAMTRAEKWLIVAAAGDLGKDGGSWFHRVEAAMQASGAVQHDFGFGQGVRLESGDWFLPETDTDAAETTPRSALDRLFSQPAPAVAPLPETLSPSDLGGAKALPGEGGTTEEEAMLRGSQIHLLLEVLPSVPPSEWASRARAILSGGELEADAADIPALLDEATAVLSKPDLAFLFAGGTLAEIPVSATLEELGGKRIHGLIDRLIIQHDRVLAVDFKTNVIVPDRPEACPEGILRQMGAYAAALRLIYPDRNIETAVLWTRGAQLMPLSNDLVMGALRRSSLP
ncbi:double-strand break repair helicase AddA [Seohaeicola saemankumensis]|uniref:DNA 3'-5' helicase n=1 Tax=Seohaeicola saemankumensis TaxID=481181 RepID=A0ABW3THE4_9RHOB